MNLTHIQIEELQQAWKDGMAQIQAFGCMECSIAVHHITKEIALFMGADDREPFIRVLKHATESDVDALQSFVGALLCSESGTVVIAESDLKGRTSVPVEELLDMARKKIQ